jgi:ribosomal protein L24E
MEDFMDNKLVILPVGINPVTNMNCAYCNKTVERVIGESFIAGQAAVLFSLTCGSNKCKEALDREIAYTEYYLSKEF